MDRLALPYFYKLSYKWHEFWKKGIEHKMWAFISPTTFVCNTSHSKKN